MKQYRISNEDVIAINRLIELGGDMASITRDETEHTPFECGILAEEGYSPKAYGGGKTIADAINEAIGNPSSSAPALPNEITRAKDWLRKNKISAVVWKG